MGTLKRALVILLALWQLLVMTGSLAPLVALSAPCIKAALASEDFPCAHHLCGCHDAATCRSSCCCFPKHGTACEHCSHSAPPAREEGRVLRCSCEWSTAFSEGRRPPLEGPLHDLVPFARAPGSARLTHRAAASSPSFLEPLSKVPRAA